MVAYVHGMRAHLFPISAFGDGTEIKLRTRVAHFLYVNPCDEVIVYMQRREISFCADKVKFSLFPSRVCYWSMRNPLKVRITFWMHTGTAVGKYYLEEGCTAGLQRSVTAFRQLNLNSPILHGKRLPQKYFNVEKACCRKQGMRPDSSHLPWCKWALAQNFNVRSGEAVKTFIATQRSLERI